MVVGDSMIELLVVTVTDGSRALDGNTMVKKRIVKTQALGWTGIVAIPLRRLGGGAPSSLRELPRCLRFHGRFSQQRVFRSAALQRNRSCTGSLREERNGSRVTRNGVFRQRWLGREDPLTPLPPSPGASGHPRVSQSAPAARWVSSTEMCLCRGWVTGTTPGCRAVRLPYHRPALLPLCLNSSSATCPGPSQSTAVRHGHPSRALPDPGRPAPPRRLPGALGSFPAGAAAARQTRDRRPGRHSGCARPPSQSARSRDPARPTARRPNRRPRDAVRHRPNTARSGQSAGAKTRPRWRREAGEGPQGACARVSVTAGARAWQAWEEAGGAEGGGEARRGEVEAAAPPRPARGRFSAPPYTGSVRQRQRPRSPPHPRGLGGAAPPGPASDARGRAERCAETRAL